MRPPLSLEIAAARGVAALSRRLGAGGGTTIPGKLLAERLGRLPKFADWAAARREDDSLLTEWQVYRMFDARRGAWSTFQFLVRRRLAEQGRDVASDGTLRR